MSPAPEPLVVLVRHGETAWNLEGRFQGQLDTDLTPHGRDQAVAAGQALARGMVGRRPVLVTSDLRRARDTAEALGAALGVQPVLDPRLREIAAGRWQGLLHDEILALDADGFAAWRSGDDVRLGGGETPTRAGGRVQESVQEHAGSLRPGDCLVAVGHGASIRSGLALLLGQPDLRRVLVPLGNTGTAVLAPTPAGDRASRGRHGDPAGDPAGQRWRLQGWNVPPSALADLLGRPIVTSGAIT